MYMSNLKFYKNSDCKEVSEERLIYLRNQFKFLQNEPQPEQRTPPWYEMRNGMLTASDWGVMLGDNPYSNPTDLILKKCGHEKPFKVGPAILWGVKYEETAVQIYEYRNNVKVIEFGLIQHPEIKYLGASPDGITEDGVMLEIKCPKSRKITGIPPRYYFDQVQGQLEVCRLDRCDFLECKLEEYENEDDYHSDNYEGNHFYNKYGNEKGVVAELFNLKEKSLKFEYGPLGGNKEEIEKWEEEIKEKYREDPLYAYIGLSYWYLIEVSCIPIYRDQEWFAEAKIKLEAFWNKILHYREVGVEELLVKKPSKKDVIKSKQIFVDTTIDDFGSSMNTDALFDDVNKKDYLFSDDEEEEMSNIKIEKIKDNDIFTFKNHKDVSSSYKKNNIENNIENNIGDNIESKNEDNIESDCNDCLFSDDE